MRGSPDYSDDGTGTTLVKKFLHVLAWVVIFGNILVLLLLMFWMFHPYNPAEISVPIEILNENRIVRVGEPIRMHIILNKRLDVVPTVVRTITCRSGNTADFAGSAAIRPTGQYDYVVDNFILPPKFKDGDICQFNYKNFYKVNPIRNVVKTWSSEEFTIAGAANL